MKYLPSAIKLSIKTPLKSPIYLRKIFRQQYSDEGIWRGTLRPGAPQTGEFGGHFRPGAPPTREFWGTLRPAADVQDPLSARLRQAKTS